MESIAPEPLCDQFAAADKRSKRGSITRDIVPAHTLPGTLKKILTGKARATKEDATNAVARRYDVIRAYLAQATNRQDQKHTVNEALECSRFKVAHG